MAAELFESDRHEVTCDVPWDEAVVRSAIRAILEDTVAAFRGPNLWPPHPNDELNCATPLYELYFGAAGVVWALDYLAHEGACEAALDIKVSLEEYIEPNRRIAKGMDGSAAFLTGDAGILLAEWRRKPTQRVSNSLAEAIAANAKHPALDLMWGAPGTMLVALALAEATGEQLWVDLYRASASEVINKFVRHEEVGCHLWTQDLYGRRSQILGAVHGFAGNAAVLIRGRRYLDTDDWKHVAREIVRTLERTALHHGGGVNWPPSVTFEKQSKILLQHCHGAPGIVTCFAELPEPIDALLVGAGELIWKAGPLRKGAFLCHGTSGNGYAFLKLFKRTGDEVWLRRARAFAMHAIKQSDMESRAFGIRRYSLWTGDLGLAVYLWDCAKAQARFPTMDVF